MVISNTHQEEELSFQQRNECDKNVENTVVLTEYNGGHPLDTWKAEAKMGIKSRS